jgi:hypothetical protein
MTETKEYTLSLTDEELMHLLLANDVWYSELKDKVVKARAREDTNIEKHLERCKTANEVAKKLLSISKTNPDFVMSKYWRKIMFDV